MDTPVLRSCVYQQGLLSYDYRYGQPSYVFCFNNSYRKINSLKLSDFATTKFPYTVAVVPENGKAIAGQDKEGPSFLIFNMAVYGKDEIGDVLFAVSKALEVTELANLGDLEILRTQLHDFQANWATYNPYKSFPFGTAYAIPPHISRPAPQRDFVFNPPIIGFETLAIGFDLAPGNSEFQTSSDFDPDLCPQRNNAKGVKKGTPMDPRHHEYLLYLVEAAMCDRNRCLGLRDFVAIGEALARRFSPTEPEYPKRGFNNLHSYVVKTCRAQYAALVDEYFPDQMTEDEAGTGAQFAALVDEYFLDQMTEDKGEDMGEEHQEGAVQENEDQHDDDDVEMEDEDEQDEQDDQDDDDYVE